MKRFLTAARQTGQKVIDRALLVYAFVQAKVVGPLLLSSPFALAAASFPLASTPRARKQHYWVAALLLVLLLVSSQDVLAQGSVTSVATAMNTLKDTAYQVVQGFFVVFTGVALFKSSKKFLNAEPDALTSLFWVVGGLVLFFGFSALKTQLVGSGAAGGSAGGLIGQP